MHSQTHYERQGKYVGNERKKQRYRRILIFLLVINLCAIGYSMYAKMDASIPNDISIFAGEEENFNFAWPVKVEMKEECVDAINVQNAVTDGTGIHFTMREPFTISSGVQGEYEAQLKLFGFIDYKNITFHVVEQQSIMPCGEVVGLYVQCDGILVLGTGTVEDASGKKQEPARDVVRSGDYIEAIDGREVTSISQIVEYMDQIDKESVELKLRRNGKEMKKNLPCIRAEDGTYKLGIWIREDTQGIGTVTYVTEDGIFGALGHGITDADTGRLMEIRDGNVYHTKILKIVKGKSGNPGELVGMIDLSSARSLGTLVSNTPLGIFGEVNEEEALIYDESRAVLVGLKQEIELGRASVLCQIGDEVKEYDAVIDEINVNATDNKGMVLHITDKELLSKTGGIIQGMSGSPILQNGKCIGAVTHVFVKDPAIGYGTFAETMLQQ